MKILKVKKEYWTKDKCHELALKCENRTEFRKKYDSAHRISCKNGWIDEICSHMRIINFTKRCIYSFEFSDNHVYIGLTYNLKNRYNRHMLDHNSSVNIHMNSTKLNPILKQLTDYIPIEDSREKERFFVKKYKKEGWYILNKIKTGSIGGITLKWTKEECVDLAKNCKNRSDFWNHTSAANSCKKNGWMEEIHNIIKCKTKEKNYWNNYDNCLNEAIKQKTRTNFRKKSSGAFKSSVKNNWKDKIYEHMNWKKQNP